jgi:hypothetical protein
MRRLIQLARALDEEPSARIIELRTLSRETPDQPATQALTTTQLEVLDATSRGYEKLLVLERGWLAARRKRRDQS